jgi:hypothetical protein
MVFIQDLDPLAFFDSELCSYESLDINRRTNWRGQRLGGLAPRK